MNRLKMLLGAVLGTASLFALSGTALGAVATYTSTDVPKGVDNNESELSTLTVPGGRPPATDIDVVGLRLGAAAAGTDTTFLLRNPSGLERFLVINACPSYEGGNPFTLDQSATIEVGLAGNCPPASGASYRPNDTAGSSTPLTDLIGRASGPWVATLDDAGVVNVGGFADDATLSGWGLRITHAPLTITPAVKKQKLRPKLKFRLACNGNCEVTVTGNAKTKSVALQADASTLVKFKLKDTALDRLEDSGNAKIKLKATNDLGETIRQNVAVKIKR